MKRRLTSLTLVGRNLRGQGIDHAVAVMADGGKQTVYGAASFDAALVVLRATGEDVSEYARRLDQWVATGTMPPAAEVA